MKSRRLACGMAWLCVHELHLLCTSISMSVLLCSLFRTSINKPIPRHFSWFLSGASVAIRCYFPILSCRGTLICTQGMYQTQSNAVEYHNDSLRPQQQQPDAIYMWACTTIMLAACSRQHSPVQARLRVHHCSLLTWFKYSQKSAILQDQTALPGCKC